MFLWLIEMMLSRFLLVNCRLTLTVGAVGAAALVVSATTSFKHPKNQMEGVVIYIGAVVYLLATVFDLTVFKIHDHLEVEFVIGLFCVFFTFFAAAAKLFWWFIGRYFPEVVDIWRVAVIIGTVCIWASVWSASLI